ncbi:MAG: hypothetical protein A2V64_12445 [Bacteroidetes bacterium RBG_13_43_22]|nr:MAG: hypothetical protein A2V64_12445 [Bacteroidetes bacterium RBG_13_43_22]
MKKFLMLIVLAILIMSCSDNKKENWIQLFNGKDFTGWNIKITGSALNDNYKNTFRVEDGMIKVSYDEYEKFNNEFGHIFFIEPFSHYKLRIEYRFTGDQVPGGPSWAFRNSGVMLHSQSAASMNLDQDFPVSIEAQFLGGDGVSERTTGNVCTPGTNIVMNGQLITQHCTNSSSKTYHGDVWVHAEFVVLGDSIIHHIIEGDTVLTYTKPQIGGDLPEGFPLTEGTLLNDGYICLQAESHPVEFRKVELLDLSKK